MAQLNEYKCVCVCVCGGGYLQKLEAVTLSFLYCLLVSDIIVI